MKYFFNLNEIIQKISMNKTFVPSYETEKLAYAFIIVKHLTRQMLVMTSHVRI